MLLQSLNFSSHLFIFSYRSKTSWNFQLRKQRRDFKDMQRKKMEEIVKIFFPEIIKSLFTEFVDSLS